MSLASGLLTNISVPANDDGPDIIGVEGSIRYLKDIGVELDEVVVLAILTEISAPTMGEITRKGFVDGWRATRLESTSFITDLQNLKSYSLI